MTGYWPSNANPISGVFVVQQVAALMRAGFQVDVIVPATIGKPAATFFGPEALGLDAARTRLLEAKVLRLPEKFSSLPGALWLNAWLDGFGRRLLLRGEATEHAWNGCIVHGLRNVGLSLPKWSDRVQAPKLLVLHGIDPYFTRARNRRAVLPIVDASATAVSSVVLVGNSLRKHALDVGIPADMIQVVGNGTDVPALEKISFKQRPTTDTRRILSVSNLIEVKGIDENVRALAALFSRRPAMAWEYRVVGDGPCRTELEGLSRTLGIQERVRFLGRLAYAETLQEIGECDVFSLPSWGEAFGIVYLEAMSRARPVIGCRENGPADFVEHGKDGFLVRPHVVDELSTTIEMLLANPGLCEQIGRQARTTSEKHTWDENARRMLALIGIQSGSDAL